MLVIGYGIAAIIVIVLLIVFNVRAGSKRSDVSPESVENDQHVDVASVPEEAKDENVNEQSISDNEGRNLTIPKRSGKNDQSYRNALRDLRTGAGQAANEPEPERKKDTEKMPDSDYRNAMRNFQSGNDKDKG
jgi:hypothetical protein